MVQHKMGGDIGVFFVFLSALLQLPAEISSQTLVDGDIRLEGINSTSVQGRVEVYYQGSWGTVCDDGFEKQEAIVVCTQLGSPNPQNAVAVVDGRFGPGVGDILIDSINCQATEAKLIDCGFGGWNQSDCTHAEDVGVICPTSSASPQPTLTPPTTPAPVIPLPGNCTQPDADIRIRGPSNLEGVGVVQIRRNGAWGGVCDNGWDVLDAKVVCRMLCFDPEKALPGGVAFNTSSITEPMTVNNVACTGNEASITDCGQSAWTEGICLRTEMAKVTCVDLDYSPPKRPQPILDCSNGLLSSSFSRLRDPDLDTKHLSVSMNYSGPCNVQKRKDDEYVIIEIPFDECGTNRTSNATHIIYNSVIKYLPTSTPGGIEKTNTYMVHVKCELPRDVLADKPIQPLTETVTQVAPGEFIVNMFFYRNGSDEGRNNSFKVPVNQFPLQIPLGEWLNTALQLTDVDKGLKLVVPNCYATPSSNKNDPIQYPLFTDKCSDDDTVAFYPLNTTWFGYRYQTFKFVQYSEVYIHCDAYICEDDDPAPQCDQSCFLATVTPSTTSGGGSARRRRSLRSPQHVYVSSGMMIVYNPNPSSEIIRPAQNTTYTSKPSTEGLTEKTTSSPVVVTKSTATPSKTASQSQTVSHHVTTVPSKVSSQSETVSNHVTYTTSHVTNHPLENIYTEETLIEEIFVRGSGSICMPCFFVVLISFGLYIILL